ncbi:MAG: hypothetical protein IN808_05345 [Rubrobacter sp.]|nr:hypothetical protein [Rubrobacter sp.]MCA3761804.1 hypothetical protein [Cutibacterium sp.]
METLVGIIAGILQYLPGVLAFYIPALFGTVLLRERGDGYRLKAGLWFVLGFGSIIAVHIMLRSVSTEQIALLIGISLLQIVAALALARLTVYRLAD